MAVTDPLLLVHCHYQRPGGEDTAFRAEVALLAARGHTVERIELHNDVLNGVSGLQAAQRAIWNGRAAAMVEGRVRATGARLVHFHNTFPLLSPAVYGGAQRAGARVVQTLYNYRLVCPSGMMLRDGAPCEECVGRSFAWPAVQHACYRGSRAASGVVATMLSVHRTAGTWERQVDAFIAVSAFLRDRVVNGGVPLERVHVKGPHLAEDPGPGRHEGDFALFVGRLSEEKGVHVLLEAWRRMDASLPLRILGDGPLRDVVERAAADDARIRVEGHVDARHVTEAMKQARVLVAPSIWYEGAPLVFAEAAAVGLPVVSCRIGGIAEVVDDGVTGVLVAPGDAAALAAAVTSVASAEERLVAMRGEARRRFERTMSATAAYAQLMAIYGSVLPERGFR